MIYEISSYFIVQLFVLVILQLQTWQTSSISQKVETKITINGQIPKYVIFFFVIYYINYLFEQICIGRCTLQLVINDQ